MDHYSLGQYQKRYDECIAWMTHYAQHGRRDLVAYYQQEAQTAQSHMNEIRQQEADRVQSPD